MRGAVESWCPGHVELVAGCIFGLLRVSLFACIVVFRWVQTWRLRRRWTNRRKTFLFQALCVACTGVAYTRVAVLAVGEGRCAMFQLMELSMLRLMA